MTTESSDTKPTIAPGRMTPEELRALSREAAKDPAVDKAIREFLRERPDFRSRKMA